MDFMKAITYPFDDDEWLKKIGLGVLIQLIPIVGALAISGWSFEIAKRVKNDDPTPLPDWSDFGGMLGKGFMLAIAGLIYYAPILVVFCLLAVAQSVLTGGAVAADSEDLLAGAAGGMTILYGCCGCLAFIYGIAAAIVYWGGYIRYIDSEEFGTFFQFGDNISLARENIGDFGMAILYLILGGIIGSVISGTGIGAIIVQPFMSYFSGHILGQLAQKVSGPVAPAV